MRVLQNIFLLRFAGSSLTLNCSFTFSSLKIKAASGFTHSTDNIVIFCELPLFSRSLGDIHINRGSHKKLSFITIFQCKVCPIFHEHISFSVHFYTFL